MRLFLLLALTLPLAACDTVSDTVDNAACRASGYADDGTVRATVSGASYSATCVRVEVEEGAVLIASVDNVVSQNNQTSITLTLPSTTPGTFTIESNNGALATYVARTSDPNDQTGETYAATSGTITLEDYSAGSAEGTFSFTARNLDDESVTVTGGRFDVTF